MTLQSLILLLLLLLIHDVQSEELIYSDERLKYDISNMNTSHLIEKFMNVKLREFDFRYEQFYNPIFGKRQIGVIAQELANALPNVVGIVPKRVVGSDENDDNIPIVLENVHVVNTEALFMTHIGFSQELYRRIAGLQVLENKIQQYANLHGQFVELANHITQFETTYSKEQEEFQTTNKVKLDELQQFKLRYEASFFLLNDNFDRFRKKMEDEVDQMSSRFGKNLAKLEEDLHPKITDVERQIKQILVDMETLRRRVSEVEIAVGKQAGEELIEARKLAEAQASLEEAKIELEKVRQEESRKTMQLQVALDKEKAEALENATLQRIEKEMEIKTRRELEALESKKEYELSIRRAQSEIDLQSKKLEIEAAAETARATAEQETIRERTNHDLRLNMTRVQAEEGRIHTQIAIQTAANELSALLGSFVNSPFEVLESIAFLVALALGVYFARESSVLARDYFQMRMGRPSLVRETSRGTSRVSAKLSRVVNYWLMELKMKLFAGEAERKKMINERALEKDGLQHFNSFISDVVLPEVTRQQLNRFATATKIAHRRNAPLRHILFYGPPGTGKTMVAKKLAKWCGLDYAVMSGADVAPLRDQAVTEIHNLFRWANATKKGVILFIDEADAFLSTRDTGSMSESLRNSLSALLFQTGSPSCRVMMVLATNRPGDLDSAILDRIDESVHFKLPSPVERTMLVTMYFHAAMQNIQSEVKESHLKSTAEELEGFSGREIAKLMSSVQAHMFGSGQETLHLALYNNVIRHAIKEHSKIQQLQESMFKGQIKALPTSPRCPEVHLS